MIRRLALHGLSQKAGDSYASANDKGWTIDDCRDNVADVFDHLRNGIWSTGGDRSGNAIIVEALSRLTGNDTEACREVYQTMTEDEQKDLAKRPDVKAMVAQIKAERAQARADGMTGSDDSSDLMGLFG